MTDKTNQAASDEINLARAMRIAESYTRTPIKFVAQCGYVAMILRKEVLRLQPIAQAWISTQDKLHPDKPGTNKYEQLPCLIVRKREIMIRQWNCQYLVWDDEDGGDFYCEAKDVSHWMLLPPIPTKDDSATFCGGLVSPDISKHMADEHSAAMKQLNSDLGDATSPDPVGEWVSDKKWQSEPVAQPEDKDGGKVEDQ